ncbi:Tn3 family transposase [Flavobacterium sp. CLA17]|uniref:Tn3 family transposase n=1 Tax=Leptolyngbya sp. Cla-17 TaxID=2803751 RepID=UPI00149158E2
MDQRARLNRKLRFRLKGFFCKAFTNLGRILKILYILRYLTAPILRQTVQLQLNKSNMGLSRHTIECL